MTFDGSFRLRLNVNASRCEEADILVTRLISSVLIIINVGEDKTRLELMRKNGGRGLTCCRGRCLAARCGPRARATCRRRRIPQGPTEACSRTSTAIIKQKRDCLRLHSDIFGNSAA